MGEMKKDSKLSAWMDAFRLRTLPLAFSCIFTGTAVAIFEGFWNPLILVLALATTLFLQVLSNLANDFGDSQNGVDNEQRVGPKRTVQSGKITASSMKKALWITASLALISGLTLVYSAFGPENWKIALLFIILGLTAIGAALKYTIGKSPYGYRGLGDLFVFLFFGLVGVVGIYFLNTGSVGSYIFLPAISVGLWASAVLNLNNMRDHENDAASGKRTLVVMMGLANAKAYHFSLILVGWASAICFVILSGSPWMALVFIPFILQLAHLSRVYRTNLPSKLDPELKKLALSTFLFSALLLGVVVFT